MERMNFQKKQLTVLIIRTGNFYFLQQIFLPRTTNSLRLGIFNPP